jgi:hypothetical protein
MGRSEIAPGIRRGDLAANTAYKGAWRRAGPPLLGDGTDALQAGSKAASATSSSVRPIALRELTLSLMSGQVSTICASRASRRTHSTFSTSCSSPRRSACTSSPSLASHSRRPVSSRPS